MRREAGGGGRGGGKSTDGMEGERSEQMQKKEYYCISGIHQI